MADPIRLSLLAGAASLCALALAAPAAAQYGGAPYRAPYYQDNGMDARIGQLRVRIDAEYRRGIIGRGELLSLRARLDEITRLQRFYYRNGLNAAERADLDRRIRDFRLALRDAADRGGGRYARGGYRDNDYERDRDYDRDDDVDRDNDYDRDSDDDRGGYRSDDDYRDGRIDNDRDGWDDRDRDRDGRWEDDVATTGMLRVGQRATANLGGVPYQYRDRYRDGGGVYYRSDGRAIYQIDARTNAVLRVDVIGR